MTQRAQAEEELRKLSVEMRYLEQTAETLQQRISMVNAAITDLTYANATLDGIEKEKENAEMLVPIGGSSYGNVTLVATNKVIEGRGSGGALETAQPEATDRWHGFWGLYRKIPSRCQSNAQRTPR